MKISAASVLIVVVALGCRDTAGTDRTFVPTAVRAPFTIAVTGADSASFHGASRIGIDDHGYGESGPGGGSFTTRAVAMNLESGNNAALRLTFLHDLDVGIYRARIPGTPSIGRQFVAMYAAFRRADGTHAFHPVTDGTVDVTLEGDELVATFTMTSDAVVEQRGPEMTRRPSPMAITGTFRVPLAAGTVFGTP